MHPSLLILLSLLTFSPVFSVTARLKDIARLDGVRKNQLMGTGMVIGLNGTGDETEITEEMLGNTMRNLGMTLNARNIQPENSAAVIITAELGPFMSPGDSLDVTVATMGDASSLQGGILLQTPLKGANGTVYAVAQGPLSIGGMSGGQGGRGGGSHQTVARIPNGGLVEASLPMPFVKDRKLTYILSNGDFATANRVADAVNSRFGTSRAKARDARRIDIEVPYSFQGNPVQFITQLEAMPILMDQKAKVVINERTGTVVMGGDVRVAPIAVAHRSLMIQVGNPLNRSGANENIVNIDNGSTVTELVNTLNLMGLKTADLIAILQEINNAGSLQAHLEII